MSYPDRKIKILLLADPLANAKQWILGLEKYGNAEIVNWHLRSKNKILRTLEYIGALFTIKKYARKLKPDVIIGYRLPSYGFLAAWSGYKPCVLAAQGITDIWPPNHWTTPFKALLVRYAISQADMIHVWGEHMAEDIIKHGGKKEQLFIMPRGVDPDIFFPPADLNRTNGKVTSLTVTRALYPEYGHMAILKAIKKLVAENYLIALNIAGAGPELEKINDYIISHHLQDTVHILGHVPNSDLPELLRNTHIYISMPETEGVSGSLFEAMACGCFPILSDLIANRQVITDAETGFLVPVGDEVELYKKIKLAICNPEFLKVARLKNYNYVKQNASLKNNMLAFVKEYCRLDASIKD